MGVKIEYHAFGEIPKLNLRVEDLDGKGSCFYKKWLSASAKESIFDAYKKPSTRKVIAFNEIKEECEKAGGKGLRVTSCSPQIFTCAYVAKDSEGNDWLIYHTPTWRYGILLD